MKTKPIIRHKGVAVYHTTHSSHPDVFNQFWYSTRNNQTNMGHSVFDIRDIKGYNGPHGFLNLERPGVQAPFDVSNFLRQAIDQGRLKRGGQVRC